jgi:transposase
MSERRTFTREFKAEAVRLATQGTESQSEVARRLGIDVGSLRKWKRAVETGRVPARSAVASAAAPSVLEEENRRLRAENERLRTEREILKKATAFFAKESR